MKAMLLAAGLGRRMLPLTLSQPKPLLPVLGRPLVVQILHWMSRNGVDDVVLNLHHLPEAIMPLLGAGGCSGLPVIRYSVEEHILGTAGGVWRAAALLRSGGTILVCNSDFLSDIDLPAALRAHRESGFPATLVLAPPRGGYSRVEVDRKGRVLSLAGEPRVDPGRAAESLLFTGCHIIEEELLDRIPPDRPADFVVDVYRGLAAEGGLGSYLHDGFWWEFGSPALYLEGSLRLLDCPAERLRRISAEHDAVRRIGDAVAAIGAGAQLHPSVRLRGRLALGYASHVGEGVHLENSIVMPEAWLGPQCRLERCIVAQGVELPAGFQAEGKLVCLDPGRGSDLPPATRRAEGLLIHDLDKE